jgi:hypothetical protein
MFSLIITIISIALVAALALATIYYGGTAFNKGSSEARASQLINEGQQINGAAAMNRADVANGTITDVNNVFDGSDALSVLVTAGDLAQVPAGWTGTATDGRATVTAASAAVCAAVNAKAGVPTLDETTEVESAVASTVAVEVAAGGTLASHQYGCVKSGATAYTVVYKF